MLEPTTAERIVRLRLLLNSALSGVPDDTMAGRHASVVALDGVCELALSLAAHELGVPVGQEASFPSMLRRVRNKLGRRWGQDGLQGVEELHRSRNSVQHDGVLPDSAHLPLWSAEVERFARSLIAATFHEELAAVSATLAVENEELRMGLDEATERLEEGDHADSVRASYETFQRALRSFRDRGGRPAGGFQGRTFREFAEFRQIEGAVEGQEEFLAVAALASDPTEWMWLEALQRKTFRTADPPTKSDAQRALAFVLNWVLRYESFSARYATAAVRPIPQPEASPYKRYSKPEVVDVQRGARGLSRVENVALDVSLSHVPPEWPRHVFTAEARLRERGSCPDGVKPPWADEGLLQLEVPETISEDEARAFVAAVIDETHTVFEEWLTRQRAAIETADQTAQTYRDALAKAEDGTRFGEVNAAWGRDPENPRITIALALPEEIDPFELMSAMTAALTDRGHPGGGVGVSEGTISFTASTLPPDEVESVLNAGVERARAIVERCAADRAASDERRDKLVAGLRACLAPEGGGGPRSPDSGGPHDTE